MASVLSRIMAPPAYIAFPRAGIAISKESVQAVTLLDTRAGLELSRAGQERIRTRARSVEEGIAEILFPLNRTYGVQYANISLLASDAVLFSTIVRGVEKEEWLSEVKERLIEFGIPESEEYGFDVECIDRHANGARIIGVGAPTRLIERRIRTLRAAGITVCGIEHEASALLRALLPHGSSETLVILDIGRTKSNVIYVRSGNAIHTESIEEGILPALQFLQREEGMTEGEAKRFIGEEGLRARSPRHSYQATLLEMVGKLRAMLTRYLDYTRSRDSEHGERKTVSRILVVGEGAHIEGILEFFQASLPVPVVFGDVFINLAPKDAWLPPLPYGESLGYGVSIGLSLSDRLSHHS